MPVLIAHPTGNQFFQAAANGFYEAGILNAVYTSIASFPGTLPYRLGAFRMLADIRRRSLDRRFKNIVYTHPWKEAGRLFAIKAGNKSLIRHETGILSVDAVYKSLDSYVAKKLSREKQHGVSAIYAYEDGAYYSFKKAQALGLRCMYDLPIGYWRNMHKVLSEEAHINPEWAMTLPALKDSDKKLDRKDEEIKLSDTIIVASSFTAKTLNDYPGKLPEVKIIPYGFPLVSEKNYKPGQANKLKLLFIGGLSQRKGLSYMFKALDAFEDHIELTVVGRMPEQECKQLNQYLKKHTHVPTLPHKKILELMQSQDVLIFPSLFEGFGLVISEAMAQGTPVITTGRTAGPDIIQHEENGWLVEAGSVEAIENILEQLLRHRDLVRGAGEQALETAKKRPWKVYGQELAEAVIKIIEQN